MENAKAIKNLLDSYIQNRNKPAIFVKQDKLGDVSLKDMFESGENAKDIVDKKGLVQMSDEGAIKAIVEKVVEANPQSIIDYKAGKDRAIGFLVGQIMKETKGKANPQMLNKMFVEEINNLVNQLDISANDAIEIINIYTLSDEKFL